MSEVRARLGSARAWALVAVMLVAAPGSMHGQQTPDDLPVPRSLLEDVMPGAAVFEVREGDPRVFVGFAAEAPDEEALVGYAFLTSDVPPEELGYNGPIEVLVGMDPGGVITGVRVTHYAESYMRTRGDFLRTPGYEAQFTGKSVSDPFRAKRDVRVVSKATISVAAMSRGIRAAARRVYSNYLAARPSAQSGGSLLTIDMEELEGMSWSGLVAGGLAHQIQVLDGGLTRILLSFAHIRSDSVGEALIGRGPFGEVADSVGERAEEDHLMLVGVDGALALLFYPRTLSLVQGADTIHMDDEDVFMLGEPRNGMVRGQFRNVGVMAVRASLDLERPFEIYFDLRPGMDLYSTEYPPPQRETRVAAADAAPAEAAQAGTPPAYPGGGAGDASVNPPGAAGEVAANPLGAAGDAAAMAADPGEPAGQPDAARGAGEGGGAPGTDPPADAPPGGTPPRDTPPGDAPQRDPPPGGAARSVSAAAPEQEASPEEAGPPAEDDPRSVAATANDPPSGPGSRAASTEVPAAESTAPSREGANPVQPAAPGANPVQPAAPADLDFSLTEEQTVLGRTLERTSPAEVAWMLALLTLVTVAFFLKRDRLRWVALAATFLYLGWFDGGFLSVSHITAVIAVGPAMFLEDIPLLLFVVFTVVSTLLAGRVFCGFLCPFGVLQDFLEKMVPRRFKRELPRALHERLWMVKYVCLAAILLPALAGSRASIFPFFEPFGTVFFLSSSIVLWSIAGAILVACAIVPRFYCRYACPLGAALAVASTVSPFRIRRVEHCDHCMVCEQACPTGAVHGPRIHFAECVRCNICEIKLNERAGVCRHDIEDVRQRLVQLNVGPSARPVSGG